MTNAPADRLTATVVGLGITDHFGQLVELAVRREVSLSQRAYSWVRPVSPQDMILINKLLTKEKWKDLDNIKSVDEGLELIQNILKYNVDLVCPEKRIKLKVRPADKSKKWLSKGIITSSKRLKELDLKRKTCTSNEFLTYFKKYKSIYRRVILAAKANAVLKSLKDSTNVSKDSWNIINSQRSNQNNVKAIHTIIRDGNEIKGAKNICNEFNNYYINIGNEIRVQNFEPPLTSDIVHPPNFNMALEPTSQQEVLKVMKEMKNKKSKDIYGFSNSLLRQCAESLSGPLSKVINKSFEQGKFPERLKRSLVRPIYKSGPKSEIENYRPISIVPTVGKVFEIIFLKRLQTFLDSHDILYKKQFGFTKTKSTSNAIISMITNIIRHLDKRSKVVTLLLDLSKAFDRVNHQTLIEKLEKSGIRGKVIKWLSSYLIGRTQTVEIQCTKSVELPVTCGVPQGSVLGPMLFNLYVNSLALAIEHSDTILYADDIALSFHDRSVKEMEPTCHTKLSLAQQYLRNLNLEINTKKTNYIQFSMKGHNDKSAMTVMLDHEVIDKESEVKYLGIVLDENLTWGSHIDELCKQLSGSLFVLKRLASLRNPSILSLFYYGVIEARLRYGIVAWGGAARSYTNRLFRLQKRAVRILAGLRSRQSCRDAFKNLKILTLSSLFLLEVIVYARFEVNVITGGQVHEHHTRASSALRQERHNSQLAASLPHNIGAVLFNRLPDHIKSISVRVKFRRKLKQYLTEGAYYSVVDFTSLHP